MILRGRFVDLWVNVCYNGLCTMENQIKQQAEIVGTNTEDKNRDPKTGQFVVGNTLGGQKPEGSLNFTTLFKKAIKKIAEDENIDIDSIELAIVKKAIDKAKKGDFRFFKDLMDRTRGKAQDQLDITSGGKPLPLLNNVHNNQSDSQTPEAE